MVIDILERHHIPVRLIILVQYYAKNLGYISINDVIWGKFITFTIYETEVLSEILQMTSFNSVNIFRLQCRAGDNLFPETMPTQFEGAFICTFNINCWYTVEDFMLLKDNGGDQIFTINAGHAEPINRFAIPIIPKHWYGTGSLNHWRRGS